MRFVCLPAGAFALACASIWAQVPVISNGGVVNGASGLPGIAARSWVSIYGSNLSTTTRLWTGADFVNGRLPVILDGVSVKINNRDAAVYFISPGQVNVLAPDDNATGAVTVTVSNSRGTSAPATATYQAYAPALFTFDPQNHIYPAAVYPNGSYVGKAGLFGSAAATTPPAPGDRLLLFGTGFGATVEAVDPMVTYTGATPLAAGNDLRITIGGQAAPVEYAGLTGNGLYQFNIVVPNVADGDQTLVARIGGQSSQSTLRLTVQSRPKPSVSWPGLTQADAEACPGSACIGNVTASPGEQVEFWIKGTNLSHVTGLRFEPNDGISVGALEVTATTIHTRLIIAATAATGTRKFIVTSPDGDSGQSTGSLNISTFRISNLRITEIANVSRTLTFRVTVDYTDPTGEVSSGSLGTSTVLAFSGNVIIGVGSATPEGRTAGATSGTMTLVRSYSNLTGTTGAIFKISFYTNDRDSDTLRASF